MSSLQTQFNHVYNQPTNQAHTGKPQQHLWTLRCGVCPWVAVLPVYCHPSKLRTTKTEHLGPFQTLPSASLPLAGVSPIPKQTIITRIQHPVTPVSPCRKSATAQAGRQRGSQGSLRKSGYYGAPSTARPSAPAACRAPRQQGQPPLFSELFAYKGKCHQEEGLTGPL